MTSSASSPGLANVAAYLPRWAEASPDTLAVAVARGIDDDGLRRYDQWTASELEAQSNRVAYALQGLGIGEGTRTVVMVKPSLAFFAITFALLKLGAPPVLVDPGIGLPHLRTCLREAEPTAFIGIPKAHLARALLGWAKDSLRILVSVGPRIFWQGHRLEQMMARASPAAFVPIDPDPEQCAAILFTSGATGVPKGVITPYRVFATQVAMLREHYGITPGERDLATFPLFALFGPALGMAAIVPDMDASQPAEADPAKLVAAIRDFSCTTMFASPAIIDRVGRYCMRDRIALTTLRRAISAGAPASTPSLARLQPWLPSGVEVLTSYGATEALPISMLGSRTILDETGAATDVGAGVCVGRPFDGLEVAIVPITDTAIAAWDAGLALPPGDIGEIVIRGPIVTPGYFRREEATHLAKIPDPAGPWHRMGDVGYLDDAGRLWVCGRKAHRVCTATETLFTLPCEAVFNSHPGVRRTALVGVPTRDGSYARPVLCVELEPGVRIDTRVLSDELAALGRVHAHTRSIQTFLVHPRFPVDIRHNAKIYRERLATWAAAACASPRASSPRTSKPRASKPRASGSDRA